MMGKEFQSLDNLKKYKLRPFEGNVVDGNPVAKLCTE